MGIQTRQESFAKELDDVLLLIVNIIKKVKAGTPISDIAAGELQDLVNAVAGVDQVTAEFNESPEVALRTATARIGELIAALVVKKADPLGVPAVGK